MKPVRHAIHADPDAGREANLAGRRIGALIRETRELTDRQIDRILAYQHERGVRFGEAAVALRFVEHREVLQALSRQFEYPAGFAGREVNSELVMAADPFSDQADAVRELRSRLLLEVLPQGTRSTLAIVSPDIGDGKTYLAANLAAGLSQLGERTLLIDADLRTPRQHHLLRVEPRMGLSNVLAGFIDATGAVYPVQGLPELYLLPAGAVPPNPLELLQRPLFANLLEEARQRFQHVIVDAPAATRGADSRVIAARCAATLVVARKNRSRLGPLEALLGGLSRSSAKVVGVVMNEH